MPSIFETPFIYELRKELGNELNLTSIIIDKLGLFILYSGYIIENAIYHILVSQGEIPPAIYSNPIVCPPWIDSAPFCT